MAKSLYIIKLIVLTWVSSALAIESGKNHSSTVTERWSIVGVISDDEQQGIAVLKNSENGRTFTVEVGESLPTDFSVVLHSVRDRKVVVKDEEGYHQLTFALPEANDEEPKAHASRFLDNYYRGFNEIPLEMFGDSETELRDVKGDTTGIGIPISNFGRLRPDFAPSRFDLYRTEHRYNAEDEADFIVNYDNFEEDSPQDPGLGGASRSSEDDASTIWRGRSGLATDESRLREEHFGSGDYSGLEIPIVSGIRPIGIVDGSVVLDNDTASD